MPNPKDILVTTTSTLQNLEIKQYLKPISAQIVAGAGLLSDFVASFTDLFGGRSDTYQKRVTALYDEAIAKLKTKAYEIGANCIIGLSIDMDEISGKGKEMFMITAIGTAVIIDGHITKNASMYSSDKFENVSINELALLKRKRKIIADANSGNLILDSETWDFIISNQIYEIFSFILLQLRKNIEYDDTANTIYKNTIDLLNSLPEVTKTELLYGSIIKEENELLAIKLCSIVEKLQLLDLKYIPQLFNLEFFDEQKRGLRILACDKTFYNRQDIEEFRLLITLVKEKFVERGIRSTKKILLSSKEKEIWTCECGRTNDIGVHCSGCQNDIYGFKSNEIKPEQVISRIEERISLILEYVE